MKAKLTVDEWEYVKTIQSWMREKRERILQCGAEQRIARVILRENKIQERIHAAQYNRVLKEYRKWTTSKGIKV